MTSREFAKTNIALSYRKNYDCHPDAVQVLLEDLYEYIDPTSRYMHRSRINLFTDLMKELIAGKQITRFDKALDIGCNSGFYSKLISDFGFKEVRGIDIDQPLLNKANEFFASSAADKKIWFENFNAENLSQDQKYDFILCTEVIEHTRHPEKVIASIRNILNPGGVAIITLPNGMSWSYLLTRLSYKMHRREIHGELRDHLNYPSYKAMALFNDPSLRFIKTSATNLFHWYFLHKFPGFPVLSRINFELSRLWPLKYVSQFFFMAVKKQ